MLLIAILLAGSSTTSCDGANLALTAFASGSTVALALVSERSPLLGAEVPAEVEVAPLANVKTLREAEALHARGELTCLPLLRVARRDLRSPADLRPLDAPVRIPALTVVLGDMSSGGEEESRIANVFDLATVKSEEDARLPLRRGAPLVARAGDRSIALAVPMLSDAYGVTSVLYGPVVRLAAIGEGARSSTVTFALPFESFFYSDTTRVRRALDVREGSLQPGDRVRAALPGLGAIDRPVALIDEAPPPTDDPAARFFVAHGLALGLPLASIGLSFLTPSPSCVIFCERSDLLLPADEEHIADFVTHSREEIDQARSALSVFEVATIGAAFATVLIPTARRGVVERWEILEDALVIGEGMLIGVTTPLWLQTRVGRARPLVFHPSYTGGRDGRDAVTAPFVAPRTTLVSSAASAAVTLLAFEDAGPGWIVPAILFFSGMTTAVVFFEVRSGGAYPSDIPLGVFEGTIAGAGAVIWNHLFWKGWPGDTRRGGLPLHLRGIEVHVSDRIAAVTASGEF